MTLSTLAAGAGSVSTQAIPEPGQVVEVRGSTWAVANVRQQGLPRSPSDEAVAQLNHAVTLQALDEDRLGEELTVVWELEVGQTVTPAQGLPTEIRPEAFDDPGTLAGFIDAIRWGAVTSADETAYQAPFRSGATVEAYQLEPLRRALSSPRTNLLLADDVGLGKTIEAGLVIQELLLRHRARTAIVVCPPSLQIKWQDEMRDKFGLDFTIVNSELMREVRRTHGLAANPFQLFPRVIVSMAWLPKSRAQRMLRDVYAQAGKTTSARRYAFDILVVDEAHHVAPSSPSAVGGGRGYAVDSQRTIAVRELAETCEHRLFLSATPHNGHLESFTALLEMIDSRRFKRGALLDATALKEVTVRRLKTDLPQKGFKQRRVKPIVFTPSEEEEQMFSLLDRIVRDSAVSNGDKTSGGIVAMLLKKRFLSSPWSFGRTLDNYLAARSSGSIEDLDYDDVLGEGQNDEEEGLFEHDEQTTLRKSKGSDPLIAGTEEELNRLADWGLGFESRADSRLHALIESLDAICRPDGEHWSNERVVVFTEYAHTLDWIARNLVQQGYQAVLEVIQGATDTEERETIRQKFSEDPAKEPVRILLATDAAGEGIDLQQHCHRLINFDIPFNPSRLEQRIGRIDRYGQTEEPEIFHFLPQDAESILAGDMKFMSVIARKIAAVEIDLGSANQVISVDIETHFSKKKPAKAKPSKDDGNAIITNALKGEMDLNVRLTNLEKGYDETKEKLHLEPANLRRVVDTALRINHQPQLEEIGDDRTDAEVFTIPNLSSGWQSSLKGLDTRLEPGVLRPITFDDKAADNRNDLVHVHLGHALLQKSQRLLRRSLWSVDAPLNRVTAVVVDDIPESFVSAVTRMVLVGRGGLRLHEEVFLAGVRLKTRVVMEESKAEYSLDRALDSENLALAAPEVLEFLAGQWNEQGSTLRSRLEASMEQRAAKKHVDVAKALEKRRETDVKRAGEIFANFRRNLAESVDKLDTKEEDALFSLVSEEQRRQRRRDIEAMSRRLDELDDEEAREVHAINDRYAGIKPHVTAAAVVFALTPADAKAGGLL